MNHPILQKISSLTTILILLGGILLTAPSFIGNAEGELGEKTVDEKRIWIWSLSQLDDDYTENYCFNYALVYAAEIAQSEKGQEAFSKVTKPGQTLSLETVDRIGTYPQIQVKNLDDKWAQYEGDGVGDENTIYLDKDRLNTLLELCQTSDNRDNVILFLDVIILHETAHWSDNVLKHSEITQTGNFEYKTHVGGDTPGEEGSQLEKDLFGGMISLPITVAGSPSSTLFKDGKMVEDIQKQQWFNLAFWNEN